MKKALLFLFLLGAFILFSMDVVAQPTVTNVYLEASSPEYSTNDNLNVTFTSGPTVVETAAAWSVNGTPFSLLYLPFEAGAAHALEDFSGSNNDVIATGSPVWSATAGHDGTGAFTFDGNDYLDAGAIFPLNSSYTKTAWIYITSEFGYRNIISSSLNVLNNHSLRVDESGRLTAGHNAGLYNVADTDSLVNNQWYFVAVTFNYATGEMILYKDAVEVARSIVPEELRSVIDPNVQIGAKAYSFNFIGNIDDARIYNRALSTMQIISLYNNGSDRVVYKETHGGEDWQVCVTPFSTSAVGSTVCSSNHVLQAAEISGLTLTASSPLNLTGDDLTANFTNNPSVVESATAWYKNGTPDALLYLPFEGGSAGALLDYSGNGNNVSKPDVLDLRPTWNSVAHNGSGAFSFDGTDYLIAGDIFPVNSSYTKTAWVYNTVEGFRNIISSKQLGDNIHYLKLNPDRRLNAGHSSTTTDVIDPVALNPDEWYFVAVTFDYATGEMILYKNGSVVDQAIVPEALRSVTDPGVLIGALNYNYEWVGSIDDARIYARVLTPQQISAMYGGHNQMVSEETTTGDDWHVEVTPFSHTEAGSTVVSNIVNITGVLVSDIPDQSILEGASFAAIDLDDYVTVYEFTKDDLVWTTTGNTNIGVSIDPVTHVATFTLPSADWYGSEDITFVATNPNDVADSDMAKFTVQNVNDAPVITVTGIPATNEDVSLTGQTVTYTDPDPTDGHTIGVESNTTNVTVANLSGNSYDLVPAANWSGDAQITITVTDNGTPQLSDSEIFTFSVNPVNDAPVLAIIGDQSSDEDNSLLARTVNFTDPDPSDTHTITVVSDESAVSVLNLSGQISGSTYDLVPDADWFGSAQITVTVTDNGSLFDSETYTYTVNPVNDPPVITEIGDQSTTEETTLQLTVTFGDPDPSDTHTITVSSQEPNVVVQNLSGNVSGSTYDLVPAANWFGVAQITVTVTENNASGLSDTEVFDLTVGAVNDAPVLTEIGDQTTDEDIALTGLVVDFTDLDAADEHTITIVSSEAGVTVANLSGHISGSTYDLVPSPDWYGSTQITVTVTDDGTGSLFDSETYTLNVNPINDAPTSISLSNDAIDEGVAIGTVVGVLSSTDPDPDDTHVYEFVYEGGAEDTDNPYFLIDGDELKVNLELNYESKNTFSLLIKSDDGQGGTLTQQITVTVNDVFETSIGNENEILSLKVYPVPADNELFVEIDNPGNKELLLEIYTYAGKLVHSEDTFTGNTINVSEFPDGMYLLRIRGENIFETRKIIIQD
jgi:hypothetical protein